MAFRSTATGATVSIRNDIVDSRYGLLLDGGRARPEDISGSE